MSSYESKAPVNEIPGDFNIGGLAWTSKSSFSPSEIACADELFCKGELLPLVGYCRARQNFQQDYSTRQTDEKFEDEEEDVEFVGEDEMYPWRTLLDVPYTEEANWKFNSCRIDGRGDLGTLSARSNCSEYWESAGEKESTSSSRDSNGSSQDSSTISLFQIYAGYSHKYRSKLNKLKWKFFLSGMRKAWSVSAHISSHSRSKKDDCGVGFCEDLNRYRHIALGCSFSTVRANPKNAEGKVDQEKDVGLEERKHNRKNDANDRKDSKGLLEQDKVETKEKKKRVAGGGYLWAKWKRKLKPMYHKSVQSNIIDEDGFFEIVVGSWGKRACAVETIRFMEQKNNYVKKPLCGRTGGFTFCNNVNKARNSVVATGRAAKSLSNISGTKSESSTVHELQSALQSAIAHCRESSKIEA